jgi:hypothetical protein
MADIIGTANVLKSCSKRPYDIVLKLGNSSRWSSSNTKITAADNYVGAGAPKGDSRLRGGGFQNRVFSFFPSFWPQTDCESASGGGGGGCSGGVAGGRRARPLGGAGELRRVSPMGEKGKKEGKAGTNAALLQLCSAAAEEEIVVAWAEMSGLTDW